MNFSDATDSEYRLPLTTALLQLNTAGRFSWHMPGHRNGRQWPDWLLRRLHLLDTTELSGSDDLLSPTGPALDSLKITSELSGAGWSRYLTAGSTSGILSMLTACPGRGGRILLSSACHQSVMHAAALLDLNIGWISPSLWPESSSGTEEPMTILPQVSLKDVQLAAENFGKFDAVLLTSPDYYGSCAEIAAISRFAHIYGAAVLVDEAHGAHLSIDHPDLPVSAMRQGADICVQSLHKTLPALTSAAVIHVSAEAITLERVQIQRLESALKIFHTSSPSFLIAATAEYAVSWLHKYAAGYIDVLIDRIGKLSRHFAGIYRFAPVERAASVDSGCAERDPLRVIISCQDGRHIGQVAGILLSLGIDIEFHDLRRLVMIPALDQTEDEFAELTAALEKAYASIDSKEDINTQITELYNLDQEWRTIMSTAPELSVSPGDTMLRNTSEKLLSFAPAAGRTASRPIVPYPPGVAIVWPGEKLTIEKLAFINRLGENGVNLIGASDKNLHVLC